METGSNPLFISSVVTIGRDLIGPMIILLVTILNPRITNAGVVIEQRVTNGVAGTPGSVRSRTLMIQGDKEKLVINDHQSIVIDASAGKVTALDSQSKIFRELPFRRIMGTYVDPNRLLYLAFKNTDATREVLGFKCRDYTGAKYSGPLMTSVTACFSTRATGSDDFSHFMKSVIQRLGRRAQGVSVPAGLPLVIDSTHGTNPSFTPSGISEKEALAFKSRLAKIRPQVTHEEMTKISSENLTSESFSTPAGYARRGVVPD